MFNVITIILALSLHQYNDTTNNKQMELRIEIFNGHGPSTTIGEEKRTNPFLR